jgi:putative lipoprotein
VLAVADSLSVTVSYRERIALPPNAELELRLIDLAARAVPLRPVTSQRFAMTSVPLTVSVTYDPQVIAEDGRYAVTASIVGPDGRDMFRTAAAVSVRVPQTGVPIDLVLTMPAQMGAAGVPPSLTGAAWTATEIFGVPWPGDNPGTLAMDAEGGVAIFGGCNRFVGQVTLASEGRMTFPETLAGTLMACPDEIAALERRFLEALRQVAGYVRYGAGVVMTDAQGRAVLHFVEPPQ